METEMDRADDDCTDLLGDISDYLDGEANDAVCAEIERHLATCENCRIVVDTLRQTVYLYRQLQQPELPGAVRERLYKTLNLPPTPRQD
jgi:anti-sigma factor RsiW